MNKFPYSINMCSPEWFATCSSDEYSARCHNIFFWLTNELPRDIWSGKVMGSNKPMRILFSDEATLLMFRLKFE